MIAALLTLVGYSVNDTIVIFDRVRENLQHRRKDPLRQILNDSLNQTLTRTIISNGTTFLAVLGLFLFGGEVLRGFGFAMVDRHHRRHLLDAVHRRAARQLVVRPPGWHGSGRRHRPGEGTREGQGREGDRLSTQMFEATGRFTFFHGPWPEPDSSPLRPTLVRETRVLR